jgi:hypothetical protein
MDMALSRHKRQVTARTRTYGLIAYNYFMKRTVPFIEEVQHLWLNLRKAAVFIRILPDLLR